MIRQIMIIMLVSLLAGCANQYRASQEVERDETLFPFDRILEVDSPYLEGGRSPQIESEVIEGEDISTRTSTIYPGTGRHVRLPRKRQEIDLQGDAVELNFEQTPLIEIVHAVMGDILQLNYIVQSAIGGEVTLRTQTPVQRNDLLSIMESLLHANGATLVRDKDDRFIISAIGVGAKLAPRISSPYETGAGFTTTVIPLKYIGAAEMAEILTPMSDEGTIINVDPIRNLLVLAGTRAQMEGWLDVVATFDIDLLEGMSVGIFPVENISVVDMEAALNSVLGEAEAETAKGLLGIVKLFPLEQLNSLLVVTPQAHYLDQIKEWMVRLDQAPDSSFERHLFVYPVQNGTATHIGELLSSVFSGESSTVGSDSTSKDAGVAPGLTPETVSSNNRSSSKARDATGTKTKNRSNSAEGSGLGTSSYNIDNVSIVADENNNALLIYATRKDYRKIEGALKQLDILPAQIVIEASILEVSLTDGLEYGLEWSLKNGLSGGREGLLSLGLSDTAAAAKMPGLSYAITNSAGDLRGVLNLLSEKSLINVISTPTIMVMDNQTADIHVGSQQPVRSSQTTTTGGVITNGVEFKDTGVRLSVTPSVNAGGVVVMEIDQSITDVGPVDSATGQRSFLERSITSKVAVRSGESVVLGGLIRENQSDGEVGIPILHDLPIIGNLFGKTALSSNRTELLVIISPHVLFNEQDLRDISREMRSRLRGLELLRKRPEHRWRGTEKARIY